MTHLMGDIGAGFSVNERRVLVTHELFSGASERTRNRLVAAAWLVRIGPGRQLYLAGECLPEIFIVLSGTILVSHSRGRRRGPAERVRAGAVLGDGALYLAPRSTGSAQCERAARLAAFAASDVRAAIDEAPAVALNLAALLWRRVERTREARVRAFSDRCWPRSP